MKKYIKWSNEKGKECKFAININGNELDLEVVEGKLQLIRLIRYIIKYTDIPKMQYKRISPFRIFKKDSEKIPNGKQLNFESEFVINFMKINDNNLQIKEEVEQVILTTYDCAMYLKNNYKIFIPDLMELIVFKGYAEKNGNGYNIIKDMNKPMFNQYKEYYPTDKIEFENGSSIESISNNGKVTRGEGFYIGLDLAKESKINISDVTKIEAYNGLVNWSNNQLSKQDMKDLLKAQINYALDVGNKEEFLRLTKEYNDL